VILGLWITDVCLSKSVASFLESLFLCISQYDWIVFSLFRLHVCRMCLLCFIIAAMCSLLAFRENRSLLLRCLSWLSLCWWTTISRAPFRYIHLLPPSSSFDF
jgi:hypothetical protein